MGRTTNISYRTSSGSLIRSLGYQYDVLGMITNRMTEGGGQTTEVGYEYDTINRLVSETRSTSNLPPSTTSYAYDLAGNRLSKTVDGTEVAYATIGIGDRLASWSAASSDGFEQARRTEVYGTSSETIGLDNRWGQLYVSNRTTQASVVPETSGSTFLTDAFTLDFGTQELVAAVRDEAGNMGYTTNEIFLTVVTNAQFGYNAAGCITNIAHTGTGDYASSMALGWDEKYQLASAVQDSLFDIRYSYDVLGRRISRTVAGGGDPGSTNAEHYIYNGHQIVADLDGSGNILRTYVWGPGIDNLLAITTYSATETNTYYALKDHVNTLHALVDGSGNVVESYEYDAWGRTTVFNAAGDELTSSAIGNRYCFQGREIDWATGLYYFRARWCDPVTGRWLSKDPIGISGGLNLYAFCGNNPVNFTDPMGLCTDGFWSSLGNNLARQGLSIAAFLASVGARIGDEGDLAKVFMNIAVQNSGDQMLREANASDGAFAAYYGSIGVSAAAAGGAAAMTGTGGTIVDMVITLTTGEIAPRVDYNPSPPPPIESPF